MAVATENLGLIGARLGTIRGAIRRLYFLNGVAWLTLALAAYVAVTFVFDYFVIPPVWVRIAFLGAGGAAMALLGAVRLVRPLLVPITDDDLALFVERHYPELNDRLISAIQLARAPRDEAGEDRHAGFNSPELVDALIADAGQAAAGMDFSQVLVRTPVMAVAAVAGLVALLLGGLGAWRPDLAGIYARRAIGMNVRWPQRTYLTVVGFDPVTRSRPVAKGDDLPITVTFRGVNPKKVKLEYRFATGERGKETIEESEGRFSYKFDRVSGPFTFVVRGNDDVTEVHEVVTQTPPGLEELRVYLTHPEYLQMENTPEDRPLDAGNITAPQYTSVRFVARSNEELQGATLRIGPKGRAKDVVLSIEKDGGGAGRQTSGTFLIEEAYLECQVFLLAKNGLPNRDAIRWTIKGIPDVAPKVQVTDPPGEETVTQICERPIFAEVKDDNGVRIIVAEHRKDTPEKEAPWTPVAMGPEHLRPTAYGAGVKQMKMEYVLNFGPLAVVPGDHVRVRVRAEDYFRIAGREPNVTTSKDVVFQIVPLPQLEKELQDAIQKVKENLEALRKRQLVLYESAARIDRKFAGSDVLTPDQAGEVRMAGLDQHGVTDKLDGARRDVDRLRLRGMYNKIFDAKASGELLKAVEALAQAVEPQRGPSPLAASLLTQAAREKAAPRSKLLNSVQGFQSQVLTCIDSALRALDKWSSYQEIVRLTREVLDVQQRVLQEMQK